ncbi:aminotransferase class III-fold pyridoxal phosphate-dependent enzyme [Streptomyces sp. XM4011]|uniref:aminotransferase class III-fold pyridoxal phosphate-dependent enzyme n=1 Tax=Streptomyces TaxID=1883 RepID=UPI001FF85F58|nr:aminotransferase class III-fold pyridoxal phosphate-dependent enzyme [Streptomyces sp. XM4011]MCK1816663.1 aminotransferase class III-fold pyridoxal phosphate-dependent enzyme [Streptomyces sp. XM4011]
MTGPVFYPWSAQEHISPTRITGGKGSRFWDDRGNRWLDLHSQLGNLALGHQHPAMVRAIRDQADRLATLAPSFATDVRDAAAAAVAAVAPPTLNTVFFTTGGADANEHAVRMARQVTGRDTVLTAHRSYHGGTEGAIGLTGDPRRRVAPPGSRVVRFSGPYPYRSDFHATTAAEECARAVDHLERVLGYEDPDTVAALLIEPVVGSNGVLVPPDGYLPAVRRLCDRYGILLVLDEVMTGFGRCGTWFAADRWGVEPDLLTFAKGVNSGYVPIGGVVLSDAVAAHFRTIPYPGGMTYSGHPLACATVVAALEVMAGESLVERADTLGTDLMAPELTALAARHPSVGEVRGVGLAWAIELVRDRTTREPYAPYAAPGALAPPMARLLAACKDEGAWPLAVANRLHLFPPLVIEEGELREGIAAVDRALTVADDEIAAS